MINKALIVLNETLNESLRTLNACFIQMRSLISNKLDKQIRIIIVNSDY